MDAEEKQIRQDIKTIEQIIERHGIRWMVASVYGELFKRTANTHGVKAIAIQSALSALHSCSRSLEIVQQKDQLGKFLSERRLEKSKDNAKTDKRSTADQKRQRKPVA